MDRLTLIIISSNVQELSGVGTEYLTDNNGDILAKFYDGNLVVETVSLVNSDEPTKAAA